MWTLHGSWIAPTLTLKSRSFILPTSIRQCFFKWPCNQSASFSVVTKLGSSLKIPGDDKATSMHFINWLWEEFWQNSSHIYMHVSGLTETQRCKGTAILLTLFRTVLLQLPLSSSVLIHSYADVSLLNQCGQFLILLTPSPTLPSIAPPATLNESPYWLTGLQTFPIKVNKIVLSPVSHMTLPLTKLRCSFA